jgi:hypothetical protein
METKLGGATNVEVITNADLMFELVMIS